MSSRHQHGHHGSAVVGKRPCAAQGKVKVGVLSPYTEGQAQVAPQASSPFHLEELDRLCQWKHKALLYIVGFCNESPPAALVL